jgi:hypothetical protein
MDFTGLTPVDLGKKNLQIPQSGLQDLALPLIVKKGSPRCFSRQGTLFAFLYFIQIYCFFCGSLKTVATFGNTPL